MGIARGTYQAMVSGFVLAKMQKHMVWKRNIPIRVKNSVILDIKISREAGGRSTMDRLTIPDEPIEGGMRRAVIDTRAVREQAMTMYWRLKKYEDTGLDPGEILTGVQLAKIACMQIRYRKMQELLEQAAEEIENCYGVETELTKAMRKQLD